MIPSMIQPLWKSIARRRLSISEYYFFFLTSEKLRFLLFRVVLLIYTILPPAASSTQSTIHFTLFQLYRLLVLY